MNILVASNMYPERDLNFTYKGIFVKEQVDSLRKLKECNVDLHVIDGYKGVWSYFFGSFSLLCKILFRKYDLIHCHYGLSAMFTLLLPFKRWDNVILTLHGGDILEAQGKKYQVLITKLILKRVGFVITLSDEMNDVVSCYTSNYQTLVCGADSDLFSGMYAKKSQTLFLFPGDPERAVKNHTFFLEVLEAYRMLGNDFSFLNLDGFT